MMTPNNNNDMKANEQMNFDEVKQFSDIMHDLCAILGFPTIFKGVEKLKEEYRMDAYMNNIMQNKKFINALKEFSILNKFRSDPRDTTVQIWTIRETTIYLLEVNDCVEVLANKLGNLKGFFNDASDSSEFWSDEDFTDPIYQTQSSFPNFTLDVNHNIKFPSITNIFGAKNFKPAPKLIDSIEKLKEQANATAENVKNSKPFSFLSSIFGSDLIKSIWKRFEKVLAIVGEFGVIALLIIAVCIVARSKLGAKISSASIIFVKLVIILCIAKGTYALIESISGEKLPTIWIKLSKTLINWISKYSSPSNGEEYELKENYFKDKVYATQSIADYGDEMATSVSLLCNGLIGFKTKTPFSKTILDFAKTTDVQKDNIVSSILSISNLFAKLLKKMTLPENITTFFEVDVVDPHKVKPLLDLIRTLCAESHAGLDMIDPSRAAVVAQLEKDAKAALKELDPRSYDSRCLASGLKELDKISISIESFKKTLKGDRVEPVGVLFMGKTSVKKSVLLSRLAKVFTYATIPESWKEDFTSCPESYMFIKPVDKFYDGHTYKSWTVLMDDAFQKRTIAGMESSEEYDTIRMINTHAFCLPMANVDGKNKDYLRSAAIFANTNRDPHTLKMMESVLDWKAVVRRFKVLIDITVNPKYKDLISGEEDLPLHKIENFDNLGHDIQGTVIPDDYWIITPIVFDPTAETDTEMFKKKKPISYEDLVFLVIETYKNNVNNYYMNKFENMRSYKNIRDKIKFKYPSGLHAHGEWYNIKDPVDAKYREELKEVLDMEKQDEEPDLEMLFMPQAARIGEKELEGFLDNLDAESFEGYDEFPHNFTDRDQNFYDCDSQGVLNEENYNELKMICETAVLNVEDFNFMDKVELSRFLSNPSAVRGFMEERHTFLEMWEDPKQADKLHALGQGIFSPCTFEKVPSSGDYSSSQLGAWLHTRILRNGHRIKRNWFSDTIDNHTGDVISGSLQWRKTVIFWNFIVGHTRCKEAMLVSQDFWYAWFTFCDSIERTDLKDNPIQGMFQLYDSFSQNGEASKVFTHLSNFKVFFAILTREVYKRKDFGLHPLTGETEFIESNSSETISSKISSFISDGFRKFWNWIKKNFSFLLGIFAIGAGVISGFFYLARAIYRFFFPESTYETQSIEQIPDVVATKIKKPKDKSNIKLTRLTDFANKLPVAVPQGLFNLERATQVVPKLDHSDFGKQGGVNSTIAKITNKYFFIIYLTTADGEVYRFAQASNIISRYFLISFHYAFNLKSIMNDSKYQGGTMTLMNPLNTIVYSMTCEDFFNNISSTPNACASDIGILFIRRAQINSTGIYRYVVTEEDLARLETLTSVEVDIVSTAFRGGDDRDFNTLIVRDRYTHARAKGEVCLKLPTADRHSTDPKDHYRMPRSWKYKAGTIEGDCGALIYCRTGNFQNRVIVGFHDAGVEGIGIGAMISKELLDELLSIYHDPMVGKYLTSEEDPLDLGIVELKNSAVTHGNFTSIKQFTKEYRWSGPQYSRIRKSAIYGQLPEPYNEVIKGTACLKSFVDKQGNEVRPLENALSHYGAGPVCIDDETIRLASNDYLDLILDATSTYKYPRCTWTVEQALHGFNTVKGLSPSTSSGFPMNLPDKDDIKALYFHAVATDNKEDILMYRTIIESVVKGFIDQYESGERPFFCFIDFLKDELLKWEKVHSGASRMISGAPFFLIILFRMFFGAFMDAYTEFNIDVGSAIGVNPYSEMWNQIGIRLTQFGKNPNTGKTDGGSGDYAKYDANQKPVIMNEVLDIIRNWYRIDMKHFMMAHFIIMTFLWAEITNSKHHFDNDLVEWETSMASGNPLTALINTMSNNVIIRVCWIEAGHEIAVFRLKVYFIALGDDHSFTVHPLFVEDFNEMKLPELMRRIGHNYTTETKGVAVTATRDISEIEFLKRKWVYNDRHARYVAPLNMTSITSMLNFTKKGALGNQITMDNIATALREISLHGREMYDEWYPKLMSLANEHFPGTTFSAPIYHEYNLALANTLSAEFSW